MSAWSRNIVKGLFVLNALMAAQAGSTQAFASNDSKIGDFKSSAYEKTTDSDSTHKRAVGYDLSKIDDKDFVAEVEATGAKVVSRSLGFLTEKNDGGLKKDSAMFYKVENEVDGYKISRRVVLAHPHEKSYPDFQTADKTYEDYTVTSPEGKTTTIVCNLKSGFYLTNVTNEKGEKYLVTIPANVLNDQIQNDLMAKPKMAFTFADEIGTKKNKSPFNTPQPGYAGQEQTNGTFNLINIDGSGFGRLVTANLSYSSGKSGPGPTGE